MGHQGLSTSEERPKVGRQPVLIIQNSVRWRLCTLELLCLLAQLARLAQASVADQPQAQFRAAICLVSKMESSVNQIAFSAGPLQEALYPPPSSMDTGRSILTHLSSIPGSATGTGDCGGHQGLLTSEERLKAGCQPVLIIQNSVCWHLCTLELPRLLAQLACLAQAINPASVADQLQAQFRTAVCLLSKMESLVDQIAFSAGSATSDTPSGCAGGVAVQERADPAVADAGWEGDRSCTELHKWTVGSLHLQMRKHPSWLYWQLGASNGG
ncbi:putative signal peptide protein [Puccinia sorghi]|uniref:Putative signal peptide protein n=1 Tax=Puccinia sorghi TaxID=27349 RepID=A0A0L6VQH9_9BASI|nr:putative signal peptide protein [Puccinia sorghi]